MKYTAYALLLAYALWLNWGDRRMLMLTALVGISIYLPAPREWPNFYYFCISAEIIVAFVALRLRAAASVFIAKLCVLMVIAHIMGYYKDGYPPFSPYRAILPTLETLEILCCVLASTPFASRLHNRETK